MLEYLPMTLVVNLSLIGLSLFLFWALHMNLLISSGLVMVTVKIAFSKDCLTLVVLRCSLSFHRV